MTKAIFVSTNAVKSNLQICVFKYAVMILPLMYICMSDL